MSKINTPYRSFEDHVPQQTLFPDQTPYQSLFPIHSPFLTHRLERTDQRSFPVNFVERTQSESTSQSNNSVDENKSKPVFKYSTCVLLLMIVAMISYNIGSQRMY